MKSNSEFVEITNAIFKIKSEDSFHSTALKIFRLQYHNNPIYKQYVDLLEISADSITEVNKIPFLPIDFFKVHRIISGQYETETVFTSSGTTGTRLSCHYIANTGIYKQSFLKAFEYFYGNPSEYCFLALLPGYLEREGSSLIFMVQELIRRSNHQESGFFLHDFEKLAKTIESVKKARKKFILIGVTYALLDFAEQFKIDLSEGIVMETGGMKGKREEMTREHVHHKLKSAFYLQEVHSEYGMTELLSQAYSHGQGKFGTPPWMKILLRDASDPFKILESDNSGGINVIDLANLYSCSFIETKDLGKSYPDGSFEVIGRFDNSEIRGCNLMVS